MDSHRHLPVLTPPVEREREGKERERERGREEECVDMVELEWR